MFTLCKNSKMIQSLVGLQYTNFLTKCRPTAIVIHTGCFIASNNDIGVFVIELC